MALKKTPRPADSRAIGGRPGLLPLLPLLTAIATIWVAGEERRILREGIPLDERGLAIARAIGVRHSERIRLLRVDRIPSPGGRWLAFVGRAAGFGTQATAGMSMRHGIFVRSERWGDASLIAHELAHTVQYERLGGIRAFLRQYIRECLVAGYASSSLEIEAAMIGYKYKDSER